MEKKIAQNLSILYPFHVSYTRPDSIVKVRITNGKSFFLLHSAQDWEEYLCYNNLPFLTVVVDKADFRLNWRLLEVGNPLGKGSYGSVFQGQFNGGDVAIKLFYSEYSDDIKKEIQVLR